MAQDSINYGIAHDDCTLSNKDTIQIHSKIIIHRSADAGSARHLPWRPLPSEPGVIKFELALCTRDGRPDTAVVDLSDPRHRGLFRGVTAPRDRWHGYQYMYMYSLPPK